MKIALLLICVFTSGLTLSAQTGIVSLKLIGTSFKELIPKNWMVLDSVSGDLNKDGMKDLVFIIQGTDKSMLKTNDFVGRDTIDLNPRIIGIYFSDSTGKFNLQHQSNEFIPICDDPTMDEPLDELTIKSNGVLKIKFRYWFSAGSWESSTYTYLFRYQNNAFELIGYADNIANRASGEVVEHSVNFSTGRMSTSIGTISSDEPESVKWITFTLEKLKSLESLKKPFQWKFQDLYI